MRFSECVCRLIDAQELEDFYRKVHDMDGHKPEFPAKYPTGALIGCVSLVDVLTVGAPFLVGSLSEPIKICDKRRQQIFSCVQLAMIKNSSKQACEMMTCRQSRWRLGHSCQHQSRRRLARPVPSSARIPGS